VRSASVSAGVWILRNSCKGGSEIHLAHAAGKLGQTLLELFLVIVECGLFDLALDLRDAAGNFGLLARAVDDRGVFLGDRDSISPLAHCNKVPDSATYASRVLPCCASL
jgi:hypothetical protein